MKFSKLCEIFEKLEKTTKRLEKILILGNFLKENPVDGPLVFDIIAGNYQRESNKKNIGISLKTIFSVISFLSQESELSIEKKFNKYGDIGKVTVEVLQNKRQVSLSSGSLSLNDITNALSTISRTSGTNKNKIKKEILSNLFFSASKDLEYKFLSRLLIDDLRVGVSEGVLREASVNALFPKIIGINNVCQNCSFVNLANDKCINCKETINIKDQKEIITEKRFNIKSSEKELSKNLQFQSTDFITTENPREIYNFFLQEFEKKYNTINSFSKVLKEIMENLISVLNANIILGKPLKSMLGTRAKNVKESFSISGKPALIDFKYDGLRIQIHNDHGNITLFSRNLDNITKQFPEVVDFIKDNFSDISFVMDSECVGFDFKNLKFLPFQTLSRRILSKDIEEVKHIHVVVKAFDILYLNEQTLLDNSYQKRREILDDLFLNRKLKQKLNFDIEKLKNL